MPGFLDSLAPNVMAEYVRYLDGDLLGKIAAKNFLLNRCRYPSSAVFMPIGRWGDAADQGRVAKEPGDGHINMPQGGRVTFEVKCARINRGNPAVGRLADNWAFGGLLASPGRKELKSYDLLIAIGIRTRGLEEPHYWEDAKDVHRQLRKSGIPSRITALPHEPEFMSLCSFCILPRKLLTSNYFRINLDKVETGRYAKYRAWGHDAPRCDAVWKQAISLLRNC